MTAAPDRSPSERELRWFGLLLLAVFGVLGTVALSAFGATRVAIVLWSIGATIALVHALFRPLRRLLYDVWMALVWPLGWAISHLALALVYYGIITPCGLVMRLFGRDELDRRFDPAAASYWVAHDPGGDPARYLRQS